MHAFLQILTNGKCKSTVHTLGVGDSKVRRISATTLHRPTVVGGICEASDGVCGRLSPAGILRNDLQAVLGSQWI